MKSKQDNQRERELRLKAQMRENLLKRKKQIKIKKNSNNETKNASFLFKGTFNG